ncbi:multidrug ABC transporter ATP-binding protein [Lysinibacillus sp. 2017]|uniref:ABC transporter ATP-binding protein n=1 Tax=unclassified Lysinibacillus TaxID=2636778 RepID=UPI000D5263C8|nr:MULTISPECIES: ABC transporter ATP-binding protein [unclassified Lysinibacillus]AWE07274.1 multidrug ABC transporter ATP-binding protein [Lysinibacillus sp. 2017]TGN33331.1 ABC transporter ATP-binding protein [Lysinibacillus sp. S2017]
MTALLQIEDVTKYYGNSQVMTKALDGISFQVTKGDFIAIMGASGSGKSTLLNCVATIDKVSAGKIVLAGEEISAKKENELANYRRDQLGFIFQEYNLLDTLTVEENIVLPLNLQGVPEKKASVLCRKMAKELGIVEQLQKFPIELSGGQRQRVACARALITNPRIILADEPTGALDSTNSKKLMETLAIMNEQMDATILMVTHDALVGSYAKRVLFLKDGKLWNELYKGDKSSRAMHEEILATMALLGGEGRV